MLTAATLGGVVLGTTTTGGAAFADPVAIHTGAGYPGGRGHRGSAEHQNSATGDAAATPAEQAGVVDIDTVLDFGAGRAAGTGLVLTASGEILTNNHVVEGATAITVSVPVTGATYTATVVGTDPTGDIAVLQLGHAAGLTTARLASAGQVAGLAPGDAVTAVGNAGGTGTLIAASGSVVALGRSITASGDTGANAERLTGLIEVDAAVEAGDSGGPLYAGGKVVGIDTAASSTDGTPRLATTADGYAIPISTATAIADRIVAGEASSTIHQGYPAFLGVQISARGTDGAGVTGVVPGSAAAAAGLAGGDTITAIDGTPVEDADGLATAMAAHHPRDMVGVTWTDRAGQAHTATVTLTTGPAD